MRVSILLQPWNDDSQRTLRDDRSTKLIQKRIVSSHRVELRFRDGSNGCVGIGRGTEVEDLSRGTDGADSVDEDEVSKGDGMREKTGRDGWLTEEWRTSRRTRWNGSEGMRKEKRRRSDQLSQGEKSGRSWERAKDATRLEDFELTFPTSSPPKALGPVLHHEQESPNPQSTTSRILLLP